MNYDEVAADIARRDHIDSNRPTDPLTVPDGAIIVDTTATPIDDVVEQVLALLARAPESE
jgi:cytidylate kinase